MLGGLAQHVQNLFDLHVVMDDSAVVGNVYQVIGVQPVLFADIDLGVAVFQNVINAITGEVDR